MKRSILRHYIGNRDEIIVALSERWHDRYEGQWQDTLASLGSKNRLGNLIDILFSERDESYIQGSMIGEAIFSEAKRLEAIKTHVKSTMERFIEIVCDELERSFPDAKKQNILEVSQGIHAHYLMSESLLPLDMLDDIGILKQSSLRLIDSLKS